MRGAAVGAEKKSSWIWRKFHRAAPPKFYAVFPCLPYLYHYLAKNSKHFSANSPAAGESRFAAARAAHKSADAPRRIAPPLARLYNRRARRVPQRSVQSAKSGYFSRRRRRSRGRKAPPESSAGRESRGAFPIFPEAGKLRPKPAKIRRTNFKNPANRRPVAYPTLPASLFSTLFIYPISRRRN